jgi:alcohol-forming fatty acyl-CoA reductase
VLGAAGAFYIRRGLGRADPELTKQIVGLVEAGHSLSFYVEGQRSRSRRFLAPKRGILRALQQAGRPAVLIPLSISYDRVAEEHGFVRELEGRGRHKGGLKPLASWLLKVVRGQIKLGRIHIRSGAALRLDGDCDMKSLSRDIVAELQRHTAATTYHLESFCRRHESLGIDPSALRAEIVRRGGMVIESKLNGDGPTSALLDRSFCGQWMHLFYDDARNRAGDNPAIASHLSRNGFWYPEGKRFDDTLSEAVLDALFEPICRDYQAVVSELREMPTGAEFTAQDLVRRLPDAFYPDVEGALDDLVERGILASGDGKYRLTDESSSLTDYGSACAWVPSRCHSMVS